MPGDLVEEEDVNDFDSEDEYIDSDNDPVWKPQDKIVDDKGRTSEEDMVADDSDDDPGWVPGKKVGEVTYTKKKKDFTGLKNKVVRAKSKQNITKINSTKEVQKLTKINSAKRVQNITKVNSTNVVQDISTADQPNSGDFLIEKEECKDGNIPFLWRFKNDGLIQKYEKKEENGKVFYQNTNNFSDWWSCYANKYEKVSTMVFYKVRSVEKVMLTGSVTSTNRGDTTSVPASDVKQQDQEISSTTPELCPIPGPDKEQFEIGSFVLDKKDCRNVDNFPIWKIESSMLIKKYEACCHQGKLLHKPVKIYRGYMDIEQHYLPLKTKVVTSPGNNDEMVEVSEDTRPKLHVSLSLESLECGNNPLLRHFYVYMQVFLSLALEPGFLDEITKINDETYMEPMNEINKLVKQKLTNIERKVRWTDNLKFALLKCPCLRNVSKPDMTKKCEGLANSEETVSDAVFLFGGDYHPDTLKSTNKQHACQEFRVGKTAMQHIQSYHQLCHFKLNLYEKCKAKIKLIQDSDKETDIEKIMDSCLGNKAWVLQNFEDFTTLVEIR
ncbi:uncharacterized protein LOC127838716 isoform X1 [Dreissena polymorpha]|uniref:uncharacterized protein LOC127838716 isoform X1 n=1 Tax=Dreissena polymorpha TaxID=45954 RepID=UPI002263B27A|nr:uncharacterized protein LOC127838716 isoform X1 [Dreissena polymorpha]XP_052222646.1 uncharacterized protein LOC127838716 isoform X1 [Dreissena polymorpha]